LAATSPKGERKEIHEVTKWEQEASLDFEALRRAIERSDPEAMLGLYAEDARLSIANAATQHAPPFELSGKAEIAKHLRATFGQKTSHRVGREVVGEDRVTFWEACEYPDGERVWVETTLQVREGKIVRQADLVANDLQAHRGGEIGRKATYPRIPPWTDAPPPDRLLRPEQATEKEEL
jgi:hypothetical protein